MSNTAWAAPIASNNAVAAVNGWLKTDPAPLGEALPPAFQKVESIRDASGEVLYHVVSLRPAGFIIIAADDLIEPVVAFSARGRFDPSPTNPLGALVAQDLPGRKGQVRKLGLAAPRGGLLQARQKWQQLLQASQPGIAFNSIGSVSDLRVAPFVQSHWNQSTVSGLACFNYYTPPHAAGDPNNYVCGCVATAVAQLLRFYQYPTVGVGTSNFNITVNGTLTTATLRGGDGLGGPYVWSNLALSPQYPTLAQCQAIGGLTADVGASVQMAYASNGSSAYVGYAKTALAKTFKYSNIIDGRNNSGSNIGAGLVNMINPNVDARCPVLLGILGSPGGHAILCDGYGYSVSTLYHHLNMGWSGIDDAWYALPTIDTALGTFTNVQECLYNVYTNGTGEIISGRVLDNIGLPLTNITVTATRIKGGTYTALTDTNGIFALVKVPSASTYSITAAKSGYASVTNTYSTTTSSDLHGSSGNVWGANFSLSPIVPTNDQCSGAILITGTSATNVQSTLGATSIGDPVPACQTNFGNGVWYKYIPISNGQLKLDTSGSSFDTVLALYTGSCGAMTAVDGSDDDGSDGSSLADIVSGGVTYYILAGGYAKATGNLVLHLAFSGPAPLTVQASPTQGGSVSGAGTFIPGTVEQISATANATWYFAHWQDGSLQNPRSLTLPAGGAAYTAYFNAEPQLLSPTWSNSQFTLSLAGSTGGVTRIDVSSNLVLWTPLTTLTNISGSTNFTVPPATNSPWLFYRAVGL